MDGRSLILESHTPIRTQKDRDLSLATIRDEVSISGAVMSDLDLSFLIYKTRLEVILLPRQRSEVKAPKRTCGMRQKALSLINGVSNSRVSESQHAINTNSLPIVYRGSFPRQSLEVGMQFSPHFTGEETGPGSHKHRAAEPEMEPGLGSPRAGASSAELLIGSKGATVLAARAQEEGDTEIQV